MHVDIPETVWICREHGITATDDRTPITVSYCPSLLWPSDRQTTKQKKETVYFSEKRRRNFSDVCHEKQVLPEAILRNEYGSTFKVEESFGTPLLATGQASFCSKPTESWGSNGDAFELHSNGEYAIFCEIDLVDQSSTRTDVRIYLYADRWPNTDPKSSAKNFYAPSGRFIVGFRVNYPLGAEPKWSRLSSNPTYRNDFGFDVNSILDMVKGFVSPESLSHRDGVAASRCMKLCSYLCHLVESFISSNPTFKFRTVEYYKAKPELYVEPAPSFLLNEPDAILNGIDDILLGNGNAAYFRNVLIQHAYLAAINNVPRMNDNNISNLLEIISFIKSVVIDHKIELPKSISDGWLAYRYQYNTTKMDVEEAISYVKRRISLKGVRKIKCYGDYTYTYKDTPITCRCCFSVRNKLLSTVDRLWSQLSEYGLAPSFYVVWDMIPFSFIADWFLPIGDVMAAWDAEQRVEMFYEIADVNFSLSYGKQTESGRTYTFYTRWWSGTPIPLQGYYFLEDEGVSDKTFGYRILDAASLIMG